MINGVMTKIEMDAMNAICALNRKTKDANAIDWEQRRYEIAMTIYPDCVKDYTNLANRLALKGEEIENTNAKTPARAAVEAADALIAELKKKVE